MAEQARAKRDVDANLSQDDPLAELANIMGMTDEQQLGVSADEIELELERELLGDMEVDSSVEQSAGEFPAGDEAGAGAADASFDDELAGELEDVLAGMDDGEPTGEPESTAVAPDMEAVAADYEDPFDSIFSRSGQSASDRDDEGAPDEVEFFNDDEPEEDEISGSLQSFDERATDPYAEEFHASLEETESSDADLQDELASLLRDGEEDAESIDGPVPEDDFVDDLRAIAGASEAATSEFPADGGNLGDEAEEELLDETENGEADFQGGSVSLLDDSGEDTEPVDEPVSDNDLVGDLRAIAGASETANFEDEEEFEAVANVDDGAEFPDAEVVGWDNLDASEIRATEDNEDSAAEEADEVDGELDAIFGDYELSAEEDREEIETATVSEDGQTDSGAGFYSGDAEDVEGADDLDQHFDERVAALFGHATPSPADIEEDSFAEEDVEEEISSVLGDMELGGETSSEQDKEDKWLEDADFADEDMAPEPLAAMPAEETSDADFDARGEKSSGDSSLDALAALERAVSDLTGLSKGMKSASGEPTGDVPDVETFSLEENVPTVQDGLGIPDIPEPEEPARPVVFDDIESEISAGFDGPKSEETAIPDSETGDDDILKEFDAIFDENLTLDESDTGSLDADHGSNAAVAASAAAAAAGAVGATASYDRWSEDSTPLAGSGTRKRSSRGLIMAALIGGVAAIGAIGAFMYLGGGSGGNGKPVVIAADNQPVKVKPADPGGKTVPNQDNKVYQRVSGEKADAAPKQKELVSKEEEPVDIAKRAAEAAPAAVADAGGGETPQPVKDNAAASAAPTPAPPPKIASVTPKTDANADSGAAAGAKDEIQQAIEASKKSDERLLPGVEPVETPQAKPSEDVAVLAPRRVRTMIVKPDGTLVERPEESLAAGAGSSQTGLNTAMVSPDSAKALEEAAKTLGGETKSDLPKAEPVEEPQKADAASASNAYPVTPERAPIVPPRPAYQPVTVVGTTKETEKTAAAAPAPTQQNTQIASAAAPSGYTVQIASQPSRDAAEQTSANLARRYETVIGNRQIAIVPAEISGKGVYYRVRVVAQSLADANDLCSRYKAAGGECFVARP